MQNHTSKIDYLLVGVIVALTGFEFLFRASIYLELFIILCVLMFFLNNKKFKPEFFLIAIPLILPAVLQAVMFNLYVPGLKNIVSTLANLILCYLVLEIVKDRFHITFVNFMFFLAVISLVFFPTQFFPSVQEFIKNSIGSIISPIGTSDIPEDYRSKTLIFFTYMWGMDTLPNIMQRNCGAFWEPGMYAVFLNLALLINLYVNNTKILSVKNLSFITATITTFSTTGYIVLFIIIISIFLLRESKVKALLGLPILILFVYISYTYVWKLEFMSNKINTNIEASADSRSSRFGAILFHFEKLKQFPIGGVSIKHYEDEKRIFRNNFDRQSSPNGLSLVFFVFGIPIGILYYIFLYKGISRWLEFNYISSKLIHFLFFLIFTLLAFSQDVTCRLFYLMFLFFTICIPKFTYNEENHILEHDDMPDSLSVKNG